MTPPLTVKNKKDTIEIAYKFCFFLSVFIQAFGLQFLPAEFIPFLDLQISMELRQFHRRKLKLPGDNRGHVTCDNRLRDDQRYS